MHQLAKMAELICQHAGEGPSATAIPNLDLYRGSRTAAPIEAIGDVNWLTPALCVIVQGRKRGMIGTQTLLFESGSFLIGTIDLPIMDPVFEAVANKPFLGLKLRLDPATINALLIELPERAIVNGSMNSSECNMLSPPLADALTRLLELLPDPVDAEALGSGIEREICYRLLRGGHGRLLQRIVNADDRLAQIKLAIDWMRHHYAEQLRIGDLAAIANMSPSAFHQHFKGVTSISPLQFQKRLRLVEARRLMCAEQFDAATAGFAVGYESPSQFNREYKRLFGQSPGRDAARLVDSNATPSKLICEKSARAQPSPYRANGGRLSDTQDQATGAAQ